MVEWADVEIVWKHYWGATADFGTTLCGDVSAGWLIAGCASLSLCAVCVMSRSIASLQRGVALSVVLGACWPPAYGATLGLHFVAIVAVSCDCVLVLSKGLPDPVSCR